jgi:hypothetical protein
MDPSTFFGAALGAFLATIPAHAGVVCTRQGFCMAQPQFQQPYYSPPPQVIVQPPPRFSPPPQQDALGAEVKAGIYDFCGRHPEESFCGKLELYLQRHPDAR